MTRYSVQSRDRLFGKFYGLFSFVKNMRKNISKDVRKNLSGKYNQKLLNHAKTSVIDVLKTSSDRVLQNLADATGDSIGNKIANKITRVSKNSQHNHSETVEHYREIHKERYIPLEERQKVTDNLRLTWSFDW